MTCAAVPSETCQGANALLLDEPFTGLDLPTQEVLFDLFGSLTRESKAVLMSTHDIPAALHHCDRVALLNRTITACARPEDLHGPDTWIETFGISSDSFLLKTVQAV